MSIRPTNYSRFSIDGADPQVVWQLYAEWILGIGPFAEMRARRLRTGVLAELAPAHLFEEGDHRASGGRIRVRRLDREWLVHWQHADEEQWETTWHNFVRVVDDRKRSESVVVDHLSGFVPPPDARLRWLAIPPRTARVLHETFGNQIRPRGLFGSAVVHVGAAEVEPFVTYVLAAEDRESPLVLVSCATRDSGPLVDPRELAGRIEGMATVALLTTQEASRELTRLLEERGLDWKLGCYGGAVRLYRTAFRQQPSIDRHPLLLPVWLENIPERWRAERTGGRLLDLLTQDKHISPAGWLGLIDRIDQGRTRDSIRETLRTLAVPFVETDAEPTGTIERERVLQLTVERLRQDLSASEQLMAENAEALANALAQSEQARVERDEIADERDDALKQLRSAYGADSVEDAVRIVSRLFPQRLVVYDGAWRAAKKSNYRRPEDVLEVLLFLVLVAPHRGEIGRTVHETFGARARYKAKDSPETMKKFATERTFVDAAGNRREVGQHVTIGHGLRPDASLQIYFEVNASGVLELAHVGEHLSTVSENT